MCHVTRGDTRVQKARGEALGILSPWCELKPQGGWTGIGQTG